ncbi:MAG TPA: hypothetical protein VIE12_02990 [Actinomycetota bacterium]
MSEPTMPIAATMKATTITVVFLPEEMSWAGGRSSIPGASRGKAGAGSWMGLGGGAAEELASSRFDPGSPRR